MQITSDPDGGAAGIWRGLAVDPENLCALYDRERDYPYPSSVEQGIVRSLGGVVYGSYTARCFVSTAENNIKHTVAASEALDSGLCTANCHAKGVRPRPGQPHTCLPA